MGRARLGAALTLLAAGCGGARPAPEALAPRDPFAAARGYLDSAARAGAFPGGVLVVGYQSRILLSYPFGHYGEDDPRPVTDSTIYDLASLTKVIGLTTAVMQLVAQGRLDLEAPVTRYLPEFSGPGKEAVKLRHLLLHDAGLPAWRPLYQEARDRAAALALVDSTPLDTAPGLRFEYSDLGAITLGQVVERVTGQPLDALLAATVFGPLGMTSTRYRPPVAWRDRIAPTERDPWRGRVIRGEVHDENAARLDGVAGHAGLFSTGGDLARFSFWLLDQYQGRTHPAEPGLPWPLVRVFVRPYGEPAGSSRALGWDTPSQPSSGGHCLLPGSFGHTGFTGTSIWIDPTRELAIILLTNRVHPTRANNAIRRVRPAVADLVVRAVLGPEACPDSLAGTGASRAPFLHLPR